jgi:exonuclease SbcD
MRILHTADWHVGKKLGRIDRMVEHEEVLEEVISIARDQKVDLVIVAGDLFERINSTFESMSSVIEAVVRLAEAGGHLLAMPGNHDSPRLFRILAPLLQPSNVTFGYEIARPERGGVVTIPSRDGKEAASVAVLPFLLEAQVVDFMEATEEWYKGYADRIRLLCKALCDPIDPKTIGILAGHFFVAGAEIGGGERTIHIGPQYAATHQAIPPGIHYAALGHIHKPQAIPGAAAPARYSGSLLQLDFSERTHTKEVVVVDAMPGRPAKVTPITLTSGRRLIRAEDSLDGLQRRVDEFGDAYLDVRVLTAGPVFGITDQVKAFLPNAVKVEAVWERSDEQTMAAPVADRSLADVYAEFFESPRGHGVKAPRTVIKAVAELEEEVIHATG